MGPGRTRGSWWVTAREIGYCAVLVVAVGCWSVVLRSVAAVLHATGRLLGRPITARRLVHRALAWQTETEALRPRRLSVVIPAINEAASIGTTVRRCLEKASQPEELEVIVVDGGSTDGTVEAATAAGATVISSPRGRAEQQNAGAVVASGDTLMFLHADCKVKEGYDAHIRRALARPDVSGGAFLLEVEAPHLAFRLLEASVELRSRFGQTPYGDQALFMRAAVFRELQGFPDQLLMEDYELTRALVGRGRIAILNVSVLASPRRWLHNGILVNTLLNQTFLVCYTGFGVDAATVHRWYYRSRQLYEWAVQR